MGRRDVAPEVPVPWLTVNVVSWATMCPALQNELPPTSPDFMDISDLFNGAPLVQHRDTFGHQC